LLDAYTKIRFMRYLIRQFVSTWDRSQ